MSSELLKQIGKLTAEKRLLTLEIDQRREERRLAIILIGQGWGSPGHEEMTYRSMIKTVKDQEQEDKT